MGNPGDPDVRRLEAPRLPRAIAEVRMHAVPSQGGRPNLPKLYRTDTLFWFTSTFTCSEIRIIRGVKLRKPPSRRKPPASCEGLSELAGGFRCAPSRGSKHLYWNLCVKYITATVPRQRLR